MSSDPVEGRKDARASLGICFNRDDPLGFLDEGALDRVRRVRGWPRPSKVVFFCSAMSEESGLMRDRTAWSSTPRSRPPGR